jgi:hypothetical protein
MKRTHLVAAVALGALILALGLRSTVLGDPGRGTLAGTISTGRLCSLTTPRAMRACQRWLGMSPVLEFSPVNRVGSENHAVRIGADGSYQIRLAPGTYTAWWNLGDQGGSITNRGSHVWTVASGTTTHIPPLTPYVSMQLDRT